MTARVIPLLACNFCGSSVENLPDDVLVVTCGDVCICAPCLHRCLTLIEREKHQQQQKAARTPRTTGRRRRADRHASGADPS
jgi:hypothetical protein